MMKIECPECKKSFVWTDDMPVTGECPGEDCRWRYNVREELKSNVEKKILAAQNAVLCPTCGKPITSRWTVCTNCGRVVIGSRTLEKKQLLLVVVLILLLVTLMARLRELF
jgi:predicted nucleic acid-binding Zn ribbon protein